MAPSATAQALQSMQRTKICSLKEALDYMGIQDRSGFAQQNGMGDCDRNDSEDLERVDRAAIREARAFRDWAEEE